MQRTTNQRVLLGEPRKSHVLVGLEYAIWCALGRLTCHVLGALFGSCFLFSDRGICFYMICFRFSLDFETYISCPKRRVLFVPLQKEKKNVFSFFTLRGRHIFISCGGKICFQLCFSKRKKILTNYSMHYYSSIGWKILGWLIYVHTAHSEKR